MSYCGYAGVYKARRFMAELGKVMKGEEENASDTNVSWCSTLPLVKTHCRKKGSQATPLTGVVSKALDGTAKGGVVLAVKEAGIFLCV